jgi:hypothetical protein
MHRNTLIDKIKQEIRVQFPTNKAAAEHFGITNVHLSRVLNSDDKPIPDSILDWIGYEGVTVTTYHKVKL